MKMTAQNEKRAPQQQQQQAPSQPAEYVSPIVNIYESGEGYVLEAEMPGVAKDGLEITLEENEITIVGHRHDGSPKAEPLFQESHRYDYRRVFELDPAIDTGKISAKMDQGVLTLTLPKSEKVKPRKVSVD